MKLKLSRPKDYQKKHFHFKSSTNLTNPLMLNSSTHAQDDYQLSKIITQKKHYQSLIKKGLDQLQKQEQPQTDAFDNNDIDIQDQYGMIKQTIKIRNTKEFNHYSDKRKNKDFDVKNFDSTQNFRSEARIQPKTDEEFIDCFKILSKHVLFENFLMLKQKMQENMISIKNQRGSKYFNQINIKKKGFNILRRNFMLALQQQRLFFQTKVNKAKQILKKSSIQSFIYSSNYENVKKSFQKLKMFKQLDQKRKFIYNLSQNKTNSLKSQQLNRAIIQIKIEGFYSCLKYKNVKSNSLRDRQQILSNINKHRHFQSFLQMMKTKNVISLFRQYEQKQLTNKSSQSYQIQQQSSQKLFQQTREQVAQLNFPKFIEYASGININDNSTKNLEANIVYDIYELETHLLNQLKLNSIKNSYQKRQKQQSFLYLKSRFHLKKQQVKLHRFWIRQSFLRFTITLKESLCQQKINQQKTFQIKVNSEKVSSFLKMINGQYFISKFLRSHSQNVFEKQQQKLQLFLLGQKLNNNKLKIICSLLDKSQKEFSFKNDKEQQAQIDEFQSELTNTKCTSLRNQQKLRQKFIKIISIQNLRRNRTIRQEQKFKNEIYQQIYQNELIKRSFLNWKASLLAQDQQSNEQQNSLNQQKQQQQQQEKHLQLAQKQQNVPQQFNGKIAQVSQFITKNIITNLIQKHKITKKLNANKAIKAEELSYLIRQTSMIQMFGILRQKRNFRIIKNLTKILTELSNIIQLENKRYAIDQLSLWIKQIKQIKNSENILSVVITNHVKHQHYHQQQQQHLKDQKINQQQNISSDNPFQNYFISQIQNKEASNIFNSAYQESGQQMEQKNIIYTQKQQNAVIDKIQSYVNVKNESQFNNLSEVQLLQGQASQLQQQNASNSIPISIQRQQSFSQQQQDNANQDNQEKYYGSNINQQDHQQQPKTDHFLKDEIQKGSGIQNIHKLKQEKQDRNDSDLSQSQSSINLGEYQMSKQLQPLNQDEDEDEDEEHSSKNNYESHNHSNSNSQIQPYNQQKQNHSQSDSCSQDSQNSQNILNNYIRSNQKQNKHNTKQKEEDFRNNQLDSHDNSDQLEQSNHSSQNQIEQSNQNNSELQDSQNNMTPIQHEIEQNLEEQLYEYKKQQTKLKQHALVQYLNNISYQKFMFDIKTNYIGNRKRKSTIQEVIKRLQHHQSQIKQKKQFKKLLIYAANKYEYKLTKKVYKTFKYQLYKAEELKQLQTKRRIFIELKQFTLQKKLLRKYLIEYEQVENMIIDKNVSYYPTTKEEKQQFQSLYHNKEEENQGYYQN